MTDLELNRLVQARIAQRWVEIAEATKTCLVIKFCIQTPDDRRHLELLWELSLYREMLTATPVTTLKEILARETPPGL